MASGFDNKNTIIAELSLLGYLLYTKAKRKSEGK